jgi:hypothetical protein
MPAMVAPGAFANLSPIFPKLMAMARGGETRIQLCGRFVVRLDGLRIEDALAGTKGQLLFAYLVLNRLRWVDRDELLNAVYGDDATPDHQPRLSVLLSRVRHAVGAEVLSGRARIELVLPPDAFVDVEAALEGLHRAESHVAAEEWAEAWGPAGIAYHVASRPLLRVATSPGWTNGGDASRTFACAGSSASQRRGSVSVGRLCRRPSSAGVS